MLPLSEILAESAAQDSSGSSQGFPIIRRVWPTNPIDLLKAQIEQAYSPIALQIRNQTAWIEWPEHPAEPSPLVKPIESAHPLQLNGIQRSGFWLPKLAFLGLSFAAAFLLLTAVCTIPKHVSRG